MLKLKSTKYPDGNRVTEHGVILSETTERKLIMEQVSRDDVSVCDYMSISIMIIHFFYGDDVFYGQCPMNMEILK